MSVDAEARARANGWPYAAGHAIEIRSTAVHGEPRYQAVCSCGRYRSRGWHYTGLAEAAGQAHVDAKAGVR